MRTKLTAGLFVIFGLGLTLGYLSNNLHQSIKAQYEPTTTVAKESLNAFLENDQGSELNNKELQQLNSALVESSESAYRFSGLTSIEDILKLNSEFNQTEALYVIAGRANTATLKKLIIQANNISDSSDRQGALSILFLKLADSSPELAIEMTQLPVFSANKNLNSSVWRSWARKDLSAALSAAQKINSPSEKDTVAQTLYMAVGISDNDASLKIENKLGIKPGQWVQWQYALSLAQRSPHNALSYTSSIRPSKNRDFVARKLGDYLGQNLGNDAVSFADHFKSLPSKNTYLEAVNGAIAIASPEQAIRNWLSQTNNLSSNSSKTMPIYRAFKELASNDLDTALAVWEEITNPEQKLNLSTAIVLAMANNDFTGAINWANDVDSQLTTNAVHHKRVMNRSIRELAKMNASETLNALLSLPKTQNNQALLSSIISQVAEVDPRSAIQVISTMNDANSRRTANSHLLSSWMTQDPINALTYITNNTSDFENKTLSRVSYQLRSIAPETAITFIDKVPHEVGDRWLSSIAQSAADSKTEEEFQAFILQYQHLDPNEVMKTSLVRRLTQSNLEAAESIALGMRPSIQKDTAINSIIQKKALTDPQGAILLWNSIEDEATKTTSLSRLVYSWDKQDRNGLRNWITELPTGDQRDNAIFASTYSGRSITEADIALINEISEESSRQQTLSQALIKMAYTDTTNAKRLAQNANLNSVLQRRLIENLDTCFGANITDANRPRNCNSHYDDH